MPPSACIEFGEAERRRLLVTARATLVAGCAGRAPAAEPIEPGEAPRAVFVTLTRGARLRGCIGSLEARLPLSRAVADAAYGAGFRDPRFAPLRQAELADLRITISVLTAPEQLPVADRAELLRALRPTVDGLVIEDGERRATFLPAVWEQLPRAEDFVSRLFAKAGLPPDHWTATLRALRYRSESFSEPA